MTNNIALKKMSNNSGAYEAGTIMATVQNADESHSQRVVIDGVFSSSDPLFIETKNNGMISAGNTTTVPLGSSDVFTGTGEDVLNYSSIILSVTSNVASKTDGLEIQFSPDNVNWHTTDTYTIAANACKIYALQTAAQYYRVKYTNGGTAQSSFNLCSILKKNGGVDRSHRVADDLSGQDDADLVKAILAAERPGNAGVYTNIQATNGGNLKVSLEEVETSVKIPVSISSTDMPSAFKITDNDGDILDIYTRTQTPAQKVIGVQIGPGDVISNIPVIIDYAHHQVHEGETWSFFYPVAALANNASADIRISVPVLEATVRTPHLAFEIIADGAADAYLHEGTTFSSGGVSQTIYNRNRNIVGNPSTVIYTTGTTALTVNALGTQIWQGMLTGTKTSAGGGDRSVEEWDLKSNTEYLLRVTSRVAGGIKLLVRINFYEDLGV